MDKKQLTFEDYLSLSRDKDTSTNLSNFKLSQVLGINGFGGHHKLSRKDLIDALNSVNLIPATRSTINLNSWPIRACHVSRPSLHEIKSDIEELGWQGCPIGSIVAINPATFGVKRKKITSKENKNKTLQKNKRIIKQVKSAESLVVDAIAIRDDVELTSRVKKMDKDLIKRNKKIYKTIRVAAAMLNDADQFSWTQTHWQNVQGIPYKRNYFKCKNWKKGCPAKRHVIHDPIDPSVLIITYYNGDHDHPIP